VEPELQSVEIERAAARYDDLSVAHAALRKPGLERLERFIADDGYATGPKFTRADCVLGPAVLGVAAFAGRLGAPDLLARHPKLAGYAGRVAQHPAIAKVLGELQAAAGGSLLRRQRLGRA